MFDNSEKETFQHYLNSRRKLKLTKNLTEVLKLKNKLRGHLQKETEEPKENNNFGDYHNEEENKSEDTASDKEEEAKIR
ncbi:hypothetical protein CEXT_210781 [Caerostris extrusa]|uniref:Uncharacterized protein n=1 Tax=Caerostris extrusa TaxID=172846 RepID=A0AAV4P6W2_CAEEX|nr:hypothetical protein CEXT_210781 [Caerostris extrusa]